MKIEKDKCYWVKQSKDDVFKLAKCQYRHVDDKLYFFFTDGTIIEAERVHEVKLVNEKLQYG